MKKSKIHWIFLTLIYISFAFLLLIAYRSSLSYYNDEKEFQITILPDGKSVEITKFLGKQGDNRDTN